MHIHVIPACRESFFYCNYEAFSQKDSGQAGMTTKQKVTLLLVFVVTLCYKLYVCLTMKYSYVKNIPLRYRWQRDVSYSKFYG
jgi:hypothetical protein